MKVIPISREYREGYARIRWDADAPKKVVVSDTKVKECVRVKPGPPVCNYQGC